MPKKPKRLVFPSLDVPSPLGIRARKAAQADPEARHVMEGSRLATFRRAALEDRCAKIEKAGEESDVQ